jgi:hypothetical protein
MSKIVIVSSHYPNDILYPKLTRKTIEEYCKLHNYDFYYEESEPEEKDRCSLHYRRSEILSRIYNNYPKAEWFVWLDSDVYVRNKNLKIESKINLNDPKIIYHFFHEKPWDYAINTGVKFVNRKAIVYEKEIWDLRKTKPWSDWPFEQKATWEYLVPKIPGKYKVHDPYVLNCIVKLYPDKLNKALFAHMCGTREPERNEHIKNFLGIK